MANAFKTAPAGEEQGIVMPAAGGSNDNDITGIVETLRRYHAHQMQLCKELEVIADALPDNVDNQACLYAARTIYPEIKRGHDFEEEVLFPLARRIDSGNVQLASTLERLRYEHWEDESFAEEVTEALRSFVTEPENRNTDKLAYMLRGFFEGLRRHIAFEREHLIPMLLASAEKRS